MALPCRSGHQLALEVGEAWVPGLSQRSLDAPKTRLGSIINLLQLLRCFPSCSPGNVIHFNSTGSETCTVGLLFAPTTAMLARPSGHTPGLPGESHAPRPVEAEGIRT